MKRKKKNEEAGLIYDRTGISQQALIQYTGAEQSTLSRHLKGTRLLGGEPALKLVHLTMKLLSLPEQPVQLTVSDTEKKELQKMAEWCRLQCIPLQQKLEGMQQEASKAACLLQFTEALEKEEAEMSEAQQRWYDNQRYTAQTRLQKYGRFEQVKLQTKIAALQKEAEAYEAQLT